MITLRDIQKTFIPPAGPFTALHEVNLDIAAGSFVAIVGESGSGKSTLLNVLAGVERPTGGTIHIADVALHSLTERELTRWRGSAAGIVFQFFQLMPTLTAAENVMLAMDFVGRWAPRERRERAEGLLRRLGVVAQANKLPLTLSGGQQQRVAIARALANGPSLLLADEPTGNLDSRTSDGIFELFAALAQEGETVVMATHAAAAGKFATRTIALADGRVVLS
ncbi:MAG TPA: ABC transporter ATP-binding protein [Gemmatimonas sp.]|nr:ABC transporter ATP-binding protein [Gemmatimonas sp.]